MEDRDDKSDCTEVLMTDTFVNIKPTDPLRLVKQSVQKKKLIRFLW